MIGERHTKKRNGRTVREKEKCTKSGNRVLKKARSVFFSPPKKYMQCVATRTEVKIQDSTYETKKGSLRNLSGAPDGSTSSTI